MRLILEMIRITNGDDGGKWKRAKISEWSELDHFFHGCLKVTRFGRLVVGYDYENSIVRCFELCIDGHFGDTRINICDL